MGFTGASVLFKSAASAGGVMGMEQGDGVIQGAANESNETA